MAAITICSHEIKRRLLLGRKVMTKLDSVLALVRQLISTCLPIDQCLSAAWSLHSPMDCSPPHSSVHGILQAGILEWVAISSSRESSWSRDWTYSLLMSHYYTCGHHQLKLIPVSKHFHSTDPVHSHASFTVVYYMYLHFHPSPGAFSLNRSL